MPLELPKGRCVMVFVRMLQVFWFAPIDLISSIIQAILVLVGWLRDIDVAADDGVFVVRVWVASGWLGRHLPTVFGGFAWLPGSIVLSPWFFAEDRERRAKHLEHTVRHELEHCRQWRNWSLLFPIAYGIATVIAMPHGYSDNYFERKARRAAELEAA